MILTDTRCFPCNQQWNSLTQKLRRHASGPIQQRQLRLAWANCDLRLQDDVSRADPFVDVMEGDTRRFLSIRENPVDRIRSAILRQDRGVHVATPESRRADQQGCPYSAAISDLHSTD